MRRPQPKEIVIALGVILSVFALINVCALINLIVIQKKFIPEFIPEFPVSISGLVMIVGVIVSVSVSSLVAYYEHRSRSLQEKKIEQIERAAALIVKQWGNQPSAPCGSSKV